MPDSIAAPAGFYEDASARRRRWDGNAWTEHVQPRETRRAAVTRRQRVRIWLNLLLATVTAGFWLVILALRLLDWPVDRAVLTVVEHGTVEGAFFS